MQNKTIEINKTKGAPAGGRPITPADGPCPGGAQRAGGSGGG